MIGQLPMTRWAGAHTLRQGGWPWWRLGLSGIARPQLVSAAPILVHELSAMADTRFERRGNR